MEQAVADLVGPDLRVLFCGINHGIGLGHNAEMSRTAGAGIHHFMHHPQPFRDVRRRTGSAADRPQTALQWQGDLDGPTQE